jgi:hypothetical protein
MLTVIIKACLSFGTRYYTLSQIVKITDMERAAVRHKLWKLESTGLLTRIKCWETPLPGFSKCRPTKVICYRNTKLLSKKANTPKNHKENGWDRMWKAIRALRRFTREDLAIICEQNIENVRYFTKRYRKFGYIRPLRERGRNVLWVLTRDAGSRRPLKSITGQ